MENKTFKQSTRIKIQLLKNNRKHKYSSFLHRFNKKGSLIIAKNHIEDIKVFRFNIIGRLVSIFWRLRNGKTMNTQKK